MNDAHTKSCQTKIHNLGQKNVLKRPDGGFVLLDVNDMRTWHPLQWQSLWLFLGCCVSMHVCVHMCVRMRVGGRLQVCVPTCVQVCLCVHARRSARVCACVQGQAGYGLNLICDLIRIGLLCRPVIPYAGRFD
jgi:hypothetical protein